MRYAKSVGWSALLLLLMACVTMAAEQPSALRRGPRPAATNHQPVADEQMASHRACNDAPPAPLPPTGPSGAGAIAALKNLGNAQADPRREWLLLVYLCGDNDIEEDARTCLKQMENGIPDSGVEVIALYDRQIKKLDDGTVNHPILYRIRKSKGPEKIDSEVLKDLGVINMADPRILSAFIEGAVKTFPAREHALFVWDHGGGWSGLLYDEHVPGREGGDHMDMPTFRAGVVGGMKGAGLEKWDILTFDMCLMGQLEVAAEIHDLADIMIASEELEFATGFPYASVLELLGKGTLGGRRIGTDIVQEYERSRTADGVRTSTLSAFDLSLFDDVNAKLNAVLDMLIPAMPASWSKMSKSLYYAEQYGESSADNGRTIRQSIDLLDALKKCRLAMPDFPAENQYRALVKAMDGFVIASSTSRRRQMSNGVAVYGPLTKAAYDANYEKTHFFKVSRWPALLQSLFTEQAKNTEPPKFGRISLVNSQDKPIAMMMPLDGCGVSIEVEGKDLVFVRVFSGMHDPALGGTRFFSVGYVTDRNLVKKLNQGVEKFAQDVDLAMPQLNDGLNTLRQHKPGVMVGLSNGQTNVEAMIDRSDLTDTNSFSIPALIEHPSYGNKPRRANLRADFKNFAVTSVLLLPEAEDSTEPGKVIVPPADARITPQFWLTKDGKYSLVTKDSLAWNEGVSLTIALLPAGDYQDSFVASTMTGVEESSNFDYKIVDNEFALHAPTTWKTFQSEMMLGAWQVRYCPIPAQEIVTNTTIDFWPTDTPFIYQVTRTSTDAEGKEKQTTGQLIFELRDQPHYRLVFNPVGNNDSEVIIGTMSWSPRDDRGCVYVHALQLEQNFVWLQKGIGAGPGPVPRDKPLPVGWHTIGDARQTVSLVVPPGFITNDPFIQESKKVFDGYDHASADGDSKAAMEIIRFDGVNDAAKVAKALVAGYKQKGGDLALGDPTNTQVDGVSTVFYSASMSTGPDDKNPTSVALYLIPTPRGIIVVGFDCPLDKFEELAPMMWKILGTARIAK